MLSVKVLSADFPRKCSCFLGWFCLDILYLSCVPLKIDMRVLYSRVLWLSIEPEPNIFLPIKAVITDMPELYEGRSGRRRQEQLLNAAMESLKWGVGKGEDARFNSWNYGFVQGTWVKSSCPAESRLDAACSWALWCFSFFDNTCNDC